MGEPGQLPPCPHCRAQHPEELLLCPNTNRLLPLEGRVLDNRFRFIKQLGEGGMSTVWMAENFRVRKRVAIKVMHPEFARNPRTLHRFQNEATAAGRIGNPHICDILDLGESPLGPYIVMEMLHGQSFAELLEDQGRIDPPLAVLIICEALKGLAAAHAVGIIHRDLKPENVFLHEPAPGHMLVKLMDFGISKFTEDPGGGRTGANVVMGTPEYMSPEQAAGAANADARTDIWAMGVMLYRALTGVEPFRGNTMAALLLALSTEDHAPVDSYLPGLSPGLIAVIDRCLAKEPNQRFPTAEQLRAALLPYQQLVAEGEQPALPVRSGKTTPPVMTGSPSMPSMPSQIPLQTVPPAQQHASRAEPPIPVHTHPPANPTLDVTGPTGSHLAIPPEVRYGTPSLVDNTPTGSNPAGQRDGGKTWSTEMRAPIDPDQSWSMGRRTFSEEESRPYTPTTKRGSSGGWVGWVVGLGVALLLGGGVAVAWSMGMFAGDENKVASSDAGGETGTIAPADAGGPPPDLPSSPSETSTDGGTGANTTTAGTTDTAGTDDAGTNTTSGGTSDSTTGGGGTSGGGTSGGGTSGGGTSGGGTSGGGTSGGGSGGDEGGDEGGDDKPEPIDLANLIRDGNLYTHKSRGPNGNWTTANEYCRSLKRKRRHGLSKWRMATVAELQAFRATEVDRLLYWSADVTGDKAKVVTMMSGTAADKPLTDLAPRAFCVSRRG